MVLHRGDDHFVAGLEEVAAPAGGDEVNALGCSAGEDDFLYGDAGNDTMKGNTGNDYLSGGDGNDIMTGGWDDPVRALELHVALRLHAIMT